MHEIELKTIFKNKSFQRFIKCKTCKTCTIFLKSAWYQWYYHIAASRLLPSVSPVSSLKGPGSPNNHGLPSCQMFNITLSRSEALWLGLPFFCLFGCFEVSCKSRPYSPCLPLLIIRPWIMRTDPHTVPGCRGRCWPLLRNIITL